MPYEVKYTTDVKPTDLPDDAEIRRIPNGPVEISNGEEWGSGGRTLHVTEEQIGEEVVLLRITGKFESASISLTRENARKAIDAIRDALDDEIAVGDKVKFVKSLGKDFFVSHRVVVGTTGTVTDLLDESDVEAGAKYRVRFDVASAFEGVLSQVVRDGQIEKV